MTLTADEIQKLIQALEDDKVGLVIATLRFALALAVAAQTKEDTGA